MGSTLKAEVIDRKLSNRSTRPGLQPSMKRSTKCAIFLQCGHYLKSREDRNLQWHFISESIKSSLREQVRAIQRMTAAISLRGLLCPRKNDATYLRRSFALWHQAIYPDGKFSECQLGRRLHVPHF